MITRGTTVISTMACIVHCIQITFGLCAYEFGGGLRIEPLPFLTCLDKLDKKLEYTDHIVDNDCCAL
jgi:hypothetical protein